MSYKLISEHEDKFELMHPSGDTFYVAKKGINKKVIEHIKALKPVQGYANGGVAQSTMMEEPMPVSSEIPKETGPVDPTQGMEKQTPVQRMFQETRDRLKMGNVNMPDEYIDKMAMDAVSANQERNELAQKNAAFSEKEAARKKMAEDLDYNQKAQKYGLPQRTIQDPAQMPDQIAMPGQDQMAQQQELPLQAQQPQAKTEDQYSSSLGMIESGMAGISKSQADLARKEAQTLEKLQSDIKQATDIHTKNQEAKLKELDEFQKSMQTDIDPNRLWGSLSTGNKIGASIGLILGGIGSGLTGQPNAALAVMEKSIANDIEAQKQDKSNKMNLYKANLEKFKSADEAFKQTQLQLVSMADLRMKQAQDSAKSNEAKHALQMARGELRLKYAPVIEELTQKKTQREILQMAQKSPEEISPNMVRMLPKEDQERFIPGYGFAQIKPTDKDRETLTSSKDVQNDLNELVSLAKKGTTIPGTEADKVNKNKVAAVQLKMKKAFELGVLSASDYEMLDKLVADPGSIFTGRAVAQLQSTINSMRGIERSMLNKLGVQTNQSQQTNSQIQLRNGVPYQKVPGGWVPLKTGK